MVTRPPHCYKNSSSSPVLQSADLEVKMAAHCPLMVFLCLAAALLTTGAAAENDHGCPEGWTPFGTRCFKFFESPLPWTKAEKSCQSHGGNLASIHSAEENTFVAALTKEPRGIRGTWIGGQDAVQENLWMWNDGSVWDYSNWARGQPSNGHGGREHFAMINWRANSPTLWDDAPEYEAREYICAKDAPPKVSLTLGGVLYKCTRIDSNTLV